MNKISLSQIFLIFLLSYISKYNATHEDTLTKSKSVEVDTPRLVCVGGDYAYVAQKQKGLDVINLKTSEENLLRDVKGEEVWRCNIDKKDLFVVDRLKGILRYDLTDPANPEYIEQQFLEDYKTVQAIYITENYIFAATGLKSNEPAAVVLDRNNISSILGTVVDEIGVGDGGAGIYGNDEFVALGTNEGYVRIFDISNLENITYASSYEGKSGWIYTIEKIEQSSKDYLLVADYTNGLTTLDISDIYNVKHVTSLLFGHGTEVATTFAYDFAVNSKQDTAFVANGWSGVQIVDISDIENLKHTGGYKGNSFLCLGLALWQDQYIVATDGGMNPSLVILLQPGQVLDTPGDDGSNSQSEDKADSSSLIFYPNLLLLIFTCYLTKNTLL